MDMARAAALKKEVSKKARKGFLPVPDQKITSGPLASKKPLPVGSAFKDTLPVKRRVGKPATVGKPSGLKHAAANRFGKTTGKRRFFDGGK